MATRSQRVRDEKPIEYTLLVVGVACLLAAGMVMVFSASSARSLLEGNGPVFEFLVRYAEFGSFGIFALLMVMRHPHENIMRLTGPFLVAAFVLTAMVRLPGLGVEVNGARRWLGAGPLTFQPSELMKVALVLYCARVLAERPQMIQDWRELKPLGLVAGGGIALVALQPDLGTALVCSFAVIAMLVVAGIPMRWLGLLMGGGSVLVLAYASTAAYRMERLTTFLDPWKHSADGGFQVVQGLIAVGSGGLVGRGLGESQQKNMFLPEAHTDFILAVIGEELGAIGIIGLLALYGIVAYAGLRIARNARSPYEQLLVAGVVALYIGQAMLNVCTVLGLAPLTGVPLPFISYGGTTLITMLAGVGLIFNVERRNRAHAGRALTPLDARGSRADAAADVRDRDRRDRRARSAVAGDRRRAAS